MIKLIDNRRKVNIMASQKMRIVPPLEVMTYLADFGNESILRNHISQIEKYIKKNKEESERSISSTPFFYAWLSLSCDLFANSMYYSFYRLTGNSDTKSYGFKQIIKCIENHHKSNPENLLKKKVKLGEVRKCVNKVIELRHCFQHCGVPNISRKLDYLDVNNSKEMEEFEKMVNPSFFTTTKEIFEKADLFISTLPKPTIAC